jgi:hypothetical protein
MKTCICTFNARHKLVLLAFGETYLRSKNYCAKYSTVHTQKNFLLESTVLSLTFLQNFLLNGTVCMQDFKYIKIDLSYWNKRSGFRFFCTSVATVWFSENYFKEPRKGWNGTAAGHTGGLVCSNPRVPVRYVLIRFVLVRNFPVCSFPTFYVFIHFIPERFTTELHQPMDWLRI